MRRTLRYTAEPSSVAHARADAAAFALAAGLGGARAADVKLVVSEAVTNAIRHGYGERAGEVEVAIETSDATLSIEVRDLGGGMGTPAGRAGLGIGLVLIAELADEFSVRPGPSGGTEVRARFGLAPERRSVAFAPRRSGLRAPVQPAAA